MSSHALISLGFIVRILNTRDFIAGPDKSQIAELINIEKSPFLRDLYLHISPFLFAPGAAFLPEWIQWPDAVLL